MIPPSNKIKQKKGGPTPNAKILLPILRHLRHLNPVAHRQKMRSAPARREQGKLRSLRGKREKRILLQILRLPRAVDTEPHRKEMRKAPRRREQGKLRACAVRHECPLQNLVRQNHEVFRDLLRRFECSLGRAFPQLRFGARGCQRIPASAVQRHWRVVRIQSSESQCRLLNRGLCA